MKDTCQRAPSGSLFPRTADWSTSGQVCRSCGEKITYTKRGTWEHAK